MSGGPLTLEAVFVEALEQPEDQRAAFVARECAGDRELADRALRLLAAHQQTMRKGLLDLPTVAERRPIVRAAAKLGRYAILHELGAGGMGVVYAAYDDALDRKIAVKRMLGGIALGAERLRLEAQALAKLQHPNVVAVHDVGTGDGELFIAMELVDGESLSQWAKTHTPLEVLRALVEAGRGLAHAHHAAILHRDFKPANVLVDRTGRARVADFGLATNKDVADRDASPMGTPGFMAPEIEAGQAASVASDIFAYCRALADLVVAKDGPPWLEPLVARGLRPAPSERWPSMDELLLAIERELGVDPQHDPRPGRHHRKLAYVAIAAMVIAIPLAIVIAGAPKFTLRQSFYVSLVPFAASLLLVPIFWRGMTATPFNRRIALSAIAVITAIVLHRALMLAFDARTDAVACADLIVIAAFLSGSALYEPTVGTAGNAILCIVAAGAIAMFPGQANPIFGLTTMLLLPGMYLHWARGRRVS